MYLVVLLLRSLRANTLVYAMYRQQLCLKVPARQPKRVLVHLASTERLFWWGNKGLVGGQHHIIHMAELL